MFSGKKIVVGVCGGIAAYKACELVRELKRHRATVRVMMTPGATRFVAPLTFQALSGFPVHVDPFAELQDDIQHIELSHWADVVVIAPATANTMAKLANGFADNVVTSTVLATTAPVVLAPAMNTQMWENPATVENTRTLKQRFFGIVDPEYGELASAIEAQGIGRLATTERIISKVLYALTHPKPLEGVKVTVTAGRTEEYLDPVRMLTNRATGRMGFALAEMARALGAEVCLISGPTALQPPEEVAFFPVTSAQQMKETVQAHYPEDGILIMAAAVADYRPEVQADHKLKKTGAELNLKLIPTPDILAELAARKKKAIHVGFALETEREIEHARKKLEKKKLDFIVVNNPLEPGAGFATETNKVKIIYSSGDIEDIPLKDKRLVARDILDRIVMLKQRLN